jgi:RoxA-like, cytochrome c-like
MGRGFLKAANNLIGAIALAVLGYSGWNAFTSLGGVAVPEVPMVLPQDRLALNRQQGWPDGWEPGQAQWFHHASQGTRILPRDWFLNLQQPSLDPAAPRIVEGDYLQRFGFLPSTAYEGLNPDGLPIGFAVDWKFDAPYAYPPSSGPVVGLTCAACHTGQIIRQDDHGNLKAARIEGGSAMINISAFQDALGRSLAYTAMIPTRLDRFSRDVLKDGYQDVTKRQAFQDQVKAYLKVGIDTKTYAKDHHLSGTDAGFARTDALSLIGNRVFVALGNENLIAPEAPVNFPPLWDTPWFDWVQYDGSIRMPLVRNIGEALGVGAPVNLGQNKWKQFASTVNVENLHLMEKQLGGDTTLSGLKPPRWSDLADAGVLPAVEPALCKEGAKHYKLYCQRCHLPPMDEFRAFLQGKPITGELAERPGDFLETDIGGRARRILTLKLVDLQEIGTDPNQALNFYRRVAVFEGRTISAATGLYTVTEFIRRDKYGLLNVPESENDPLNLEYNRYRAFDAKVPKAKVVDGMGMEKVLAANLKYRARPLDGIWATPPFLHNGSVPNLYQLLRPVAEREKKFYLGTTKYDAKVVGYQTQQFEGGFELDTNEPGNSNNGHEFRNLTLTELELVPEIWAACDSPPKPAGDEPARWARVLGYPLDEYAGFDESRKTEETRKATWRALNVERVKREHPFRGVIGAELTEKERWELIEYVKSL